MSMSLSISFLIVRKPRTLGVLVAMAPSTSQYTLVQLTDSDEG